MDPKNVASTGVISLSKAKLFIVKSKFRLKSVELAVANQKQNAGNCPFVLDYFDGCLVRSLSPRARFSSSYFNIRY